MAIGVTHFSDPGCPWAYSASPAHAVLRWRYGDQLRWRLVMIGLTEEADQYVRRGYTPAGSARGYLRFRRRGMPFATQPRARVCATGLRLPRDRRDAPARAGATSCAVFRALQFAWFTTPLVLDDPDDLSRRSGASTASTPPRSSPRSTTLRSRSAYQADRAEARTAEGSPTRGAGQGRPDRRRRCATPRRR